MLPAAIFAGRAFSQNSADMAERFRQMSEDAERKGLAEPFKGVTTSAGIEPNLFQVQKTGVSTEPVRNAADVAAADQGLKELLYFDLLTAGIYMARRGMTALSLPIGDAECDAMVSAVAEFIDRRQALLR